MGSFSCIAAADEEDYVIHHKFFNMLASDLKCKLISHMPSYISGSMQDMGAGDEVISGYRICLPAKGEDDRILKKLIKAATRSKRMGASVVVLENKILCDYGYKMIEEKCGIKVARGVVYPPLAFIDAAKSVSSLMGIDFKRSNICIADAATEMGLIMTELLLSEAAYLTLCTFDKPKINGNTEKYIKICGLSPVVVSSYKKTMEACDILIYTAGMDIDELISYAQRKLLIINMSQETLKLCKDLLVIDDVILKGPKEPVVGDSVTDADTFMTSRVWEGVLSMVSDIDISVYNYKKSVEAGIWAKKMGITLKAVMKGDRIIDRENIYMYK